jgi:glycosyltransferase involved in cell wall biosynthesis
MFNSNTWETTLLVLHIMDSLRILVFSWRCPKHPQAGGAEKATYEVAKRWVGQGNSVQWVCGNFSGGQSKDEIGGITIQRLGGKYSVYLGSVWKYFRELRGKFDVVVDEINNIPFFTPLYVKEPSVVFIHQLGENMLFEELPWATAKLCNFIEPRILELYKDKPIITSPSTREDLLRIGFSERMVNVINYGVDHSVYNLGREKSAFPHVLFLGRLKRFKGVHILLEAMRQVVNEIPDAKLSIIGTGDPDYVAELKSLQTRLKLNKNVIFYELGFGDSLMKKVELLQSAWTVVFPSIREGFGLVVVEANACGTPTISTDVPGLRDTVRHYETGLLVSRTPASLAKSITHLLKDDELRGRMSKNAFDWSQQFNWDLTADNMLKVLTNSAISRGKSN